MTSECAVKFECRGEQLVGVITKGAGEKSVGVLVLVGGPQYRVGSHRQFTLFARALAQRGIPVMRFDFRGMGDSTGTAPGFEDTTPDIQAAIDAFAKECPFINQMILWGLCDAASAALLFWGAQRDERVAGMVLLNPWVRSDASLARTHIKHYYGHRLIERAFWSKLVKGEVPIGAALRTFLATLFASSRSRAQARPDETYQQRMAAAAEAFGKPILLVLSGRDLTAKEFVDHAAHDACWLRAFQSDGVERHELTEADHTFSSAAWRAEVERLTRDWVERRFRT